MSFCFSNASPIVRGGLSSLESYKSGCRENLICIHHYFQLHVVEFKCCGTSDTICAIHLVSFPLYLPAASHDRFHPPILPYSLSTTVESVHWHWAAHILNEEEQVRQGGIKHHLMLIAFISSFKIPVLPFFYK